MKTLFYRYIGKILTDEYLIKFLCLFFATLSQLSLVNNTSINNEGKLKVDPIEQQQLYTFQQEKIENIYMKYLTTIVDWENSVCDLEKHLKTTLCENIFNVLHYKRLNIFLNKTAVFVNNLKCVKQSVILKSKLLFYDEIIMQPMYPCYGRHYPVRTDYMSDDYYLKFYLSSSFHRNSIMVYNCDHNMDMKNCYVYNYIENINVALSAAITITIQNISNELNLNTNVTFNINKKRLEHIYIREKDYNENDPLCDLKGEEKMSLCNLIFNQNIYKSTLWITLNKTAHAITSSNCFKAKIRFQYPTIHKYISRSSRNLYFTQTMYSCHSKNRLVFQNPLRFKYLESFSISSGPRKNSVFVYYKVHHKNSGRDSSTYHLFQLIENIDIDHIKPLKLDGEEIKRESPGTSQYVHELLHMIKLKRKIESLKQENIKIDVVNEIEKRTTKIIQNHRTPIYSREMEILFSTLYSKILDIIDDNEHEILFEMSEYTIEENILKQKLIEYSDHINILQTNITQKHIQNVFLLFKKK